jgi:uncharacterized protein YqfB (UPF0267 family)
MVREFKKPDVKAPRCRKVAARLLGKKFLEEFVSKHPKYKNLTLDELKSILRTFHGKLWDHAVHNRDGVELPENLGFLFIGTCASAKKYNTDFGNSIRGEFRHRHRNFESDNYLAKIFYTNYNSRYKFKFRELWSFSATRDFKRTVAKVYPEKWKTYVYVESGRNIARYMATYRKDQYFKYIKENFEIDESYNEFDLN